MARAICRMSNTETASTSSLDDHEGNSTAVDAISERLTEVTRLAEKLDERLYEAGARIRTASRQIEERANGNGSTSLKCEQEASSEAKKSETVDEDGGGIDKNTDNDIDESWTEDFVTATECTTTPMARSRSESFATMSEGEDALHSSEPRNIRCVPNQSPPFSLSFSFPLPPTPAADYIYFQRLFIGEQLLTARRMRGERERERQVDL